MLPEIHRVGENRAALNPDYLLMDVSSEQPGYSSLRSEERADSLAPARPQDGLIRPAFDLMIERQNPNLKAAHQDACFRSRSRHSCSRSADNAPALGVGP
jgi:hypothetical protein